MNRVRRAATLVLLGLAPSLCGFFPFANPSQPAATIVLTRATNVGINGGNVTILGTGFSAATVQFKTAGGAGPWTMCGAGRTCTPVSSSGTQIVVNVPPLAASDYDVLVSNVGGAPAFAPAFLTVSATITPATIGGANLILWWRATDDTDTGDGTPTTAVADKSSTGNVPTTIVAVTHNDSSANFNNQPTWSFNGTSSTFLVGSLNLTTGNTVHCTMAVRLGAAGTNPTFWGELASVLRGSASTSIPQVVDNVIATWSSPVLNTSVDLEAYLQKTGPASVTVGAAVNGQALVTNSGTGAPPGTTGDTNSFGSANAAGVATGPYAQEELAEVACYDAVLDAAQRAQSASYFNLRYGLTPPPTLSTTCGVSGTSPCATDVSSTSAGTQSWRVNGANFASGMTATVSHGGVSIGTVTTTYVSSTIAEMSIPAGSYAAHLYDLELTNPDSGQSTQLNAINVTTALNPSTIFGAACKGWWQANEVSTSSGNVTNWVDQCLRGNDVGSNTAMAYSASDAAFGGQPIATLDGSTSFASLAALNGIAVGDPLFLWVVVKLGATSASALFLDYAGVDELQFNQNGSAAGKPNILLGGTNTAWATSIGTSASHLVYVYESGGSSWTQAVCVDCASSSSEVTASVTSTAIQAAATLLVGKRAGGNFMNGKVAAFGAANAVPNTAQVANLRGWSSPLFGTP